MRGGGGGGWQLLPEPLAHLGAGRVLGGKSDGAGGLWLCDAVQGLLKVERLGGGPGVTRVVLAASQASCAAAAPRCPAREPQLCPDPPRRRPALAHNRQTRPRRAAASASNPACPPSPPCRWRSARRWTRAAPSATRTTWTWRRTAASTSRTPPPSRRCAAVAGATTCSGPSTSLWRWGAPQVGRRLLAAGRLLLPGDSWPQSARPLPPASPHTPHPALLLPAPPGRLLRYSPSSGEAHVLAKGFWFANGVALAPDESYVLVADSIRMALLKVWLQVSERQRLPGGGCLGAELGECWGRHQVLLLLARSGRAPTCPQRPSQHPPPYTRPSTAAGPQGRAGRAADRAPAGPPGRRHARRQRRLLADPLLAAHQGPPDRAPLPAAPAHGLAAQE